MALAGIYNLCINEGATLQPTTIRLVDSVTGGAVDLTGLNVRSKISATYGADTVLVYPTTVITDVTGGEISLELASDHGLADNISPLSFSKFAESWPTKADLSSVETALFNIGMRPYVWDLETYDSATPPVVVRRLNGMVVVTSEAPE
jgi:hypothetical protein